MIHFSQIILTTLTTNDLFHFSNPPVPCPAGMYSLGGKFENCTACPAGSACPDPAGVPVSCTGGKRW